MSAVSIPKSPTRSGKSLTSPHMSAPDLDLSVEKEPEPQCVPIFDVNEDMESDGLMASQLFSNQGQARPALTYGCACSTAAVPPQARAGRRRSLSANRCFRRFRTRAATSSCSRATCTSESMTWSRPRS